MKLIFGIYLDINRGRDFCEFIKSEHALKSLFKPKKDFDQSNCIISQIKISWKRIEVSIEVKNWFQMGFFIVIRHPVRAQNMFQNDESAISQEQIVLWTDCLCWFTSEAITWWEDQIGVASHAQASPKFFQIISNILMNRQYHGYTMKALCVCE